MQTLRIKNENYLLGLLKSHWLILLCELAFYCNMIIYATMIRFGNRSGLEYCKEGYCIFKLWLGLRLTVWNKKYKIKLYIYINLNLAHRAIPYRIKCAVLGECRLNQFRHSDEVMNFRAYETVKQKKRQKEEDRQKSKRDCV